MEEQTQVKPVEDKKETSPQEKEAAVLDAAIKEGDVNPEYGLQKDGVYKINLDKPPKQKEDAVQEQSTNEIPVRGGSETSEEVQKENKEESEEPTGKDKQEENNQSNKKEQREEIESPLELVTNEKNTADEARVDTVVKNPEPVQEQEEILPEAKTQKLPENIENLLKFMEDTGGTLEDYVNLNKDFSKMDNISLLREYYKTTKPHLDGEDLNFLMNKNFSYDEESDEPSDIKAKKLAFKEELYNAQKFFDNNKKQYYADLKLRKEENVSPEYIKAMEYYKTKQQEQEDWTEQQKIFLNRTEKVFNKDFKGFDFQVGENKYRFKIDNANKVKEYQSDLKNFINEYIAEDGTLGNANEYHKALFAGRNADKIANHFYEQGRADAIKDAAEKANNIDMNPRVDNSTITTSSGDKIRVVSGNSSDKLRIKWNK